TADVPDALRRLCARYAATHGPFTTDEMQARYGVDPSSALRELEAAGELVRGELRPGGSEREWCDPEVLRRLRRASLAVLRKEVEPADQRAFASFLPSWQGVDRHPAGGAGVDRLREVLVPLQGLALPADVWERDVLPRRVGAYSTTWLDQLCASGEVVWVGAGAPRLTLARAQRAAGRARAGRRFGARRGGAQPIVQGRWALTSTIFRAEPDVGARRRTVAELLLERYGIVTREQVLAEGIPGGFSILYDALGQLETLGVCRRGYFVEGLGGAQFALPGAVERLRSQRADEETPPIVLAATDPAQPYGAALPWPKRDVNDRRRLKRVAGGNVVFDGVETDLD